MDLIDRRLDRLARSRFRTSFTLSESDRNYLRQKGWQTVARHAEELIRARLGQALPRNDGRQTPRQGHPVFVAQHATATCCRKCVQQWHGIPRGRDLSQEEIALLAAIVLRWLRRWVGPLFDYAAEENDARQLMLPLD